MLLLVVAVVALALCRRKKTQKSKQEHFRTDENHCTGLTAEDPSRTESTAMEMWSSLLIIMKPMDNE